MIVSMGLEDAVPESCHQSDIFITRTLLPIEQAHAISIHSESPPLSIGSFHFNLQPFDIRLSGVTGKIQTSLPVICARMCMIVPAPSFPWYYVWSMVLLEQL